MIAFDQTKADAVVTATDCLVRVFCNALCRADWRNNVYTPNALADRNIYGCWQCGEDLLQGLILDTPMADDHLWRKGRQA